MDHPDPDSRAQKAAIARTERQVLPSIPPSERKAVASRVAVGFSMEETKRWKLKKQKDFGAFAPLLVGVSGI